MSGEKSDETWQLFVKTTSNVTIIVNEVGPHTKVKDLVTKICAKTEIPREHMYLVCNGKSFGQNGNDEMALYEVNIKN